MYKKQKEKLRHIYDNAIEGIFRTTLNGKTIATDGNNVPLTKYFMFNNMKLKFK